MLIRPFTFSPCVCLYTTEEYNCTRRDVASSRVWVQYMSNQIHTVLLGSRLFCSGACRVWVTPCQSRRCRLTGRFLSKHEHLLCASCALTMSYYYVAYDGQQASAVTPKSSRNVQGYPATLTSFLCYFVSTGRRHRQTICATFTAAGQSPTTPWCLGKASRHG